MIEIGNKKFSLGAYIAILTLVIILIIIAFCMYKYTVEGEAKPPFIISKIIVVSTAETANTTNAIEGYAATVLQNNDIKISITKNPEYKKDAIIKKITINNFVIDGIDNKENISVYRPSMGENLYDYEEKYIIKDNLEYIGAQETYLKDENLEISNQGGILEFSVANYDLGKVRYTENEQIKIDGTLLKTLNIEQKDIEFKLTFDLIIELENDVKLKTTITMDLPKGNIIEDGIKTYEHTDCDVVFKRI